MLVRNLRKKIYDFQENPGFYSNIILKSALKSFYIIDRIVLKRAEKADLNTEKLYSHDKKFFCALVPKCGSRTIINGFQSASKDNFDLVIFEGSTKKCVGVYDNYFKFTFVRDPWARCYSCYRQKVEQFTPIKGALHFSGRPGLSPEMTFAEFVHWLASDAGRDDIADRHWLSQYRTLGLDLGMQYDFIGKLESMEADLVAISERLEIDSSVFREVINKTSDPDRYLSHYTPELVEIVGRRYARDIETFGYKPPSI